VERRMGWVCSGESGGRGVWGKEECHAMALELESEAIAALCKAYGAR
jgi:hypothetical protein